MAVAVGSTSTLALGSGRTTSTITAPTSIANGDLLLAIVYAGDAGDLVAPAITGPAGFTKVTGSPFTTSLAADNFAVGLNIFWKIAASESGSYAFTHSSASTQAIMYRLTGAHQTAPIAPTPTSAAYIGDVAAVGKLATAPGLTTSANGSLVIYAVGLWDGGPGTPPTGSTPTFTERLDAGGMYVADGVLATAGATGNKVNASGFTAQATTSPWVAMLIAVSPPTVAAYSVTATGGSYSFTGSPATPVKTGNKSITAGAGSYSFTGSTVTLTKATVGSGVPTFRAIANSTYGNFHTDTTVAKPTGTVDGDVMIAGIMVAQSDETAVVITPPAGWTLIGTPQLVTDGGGFDSRFWVYWKRASSEGSSYVWLHEGGPAVYSQGVIASYSGCASSGSPIDVFSQNFKTGSAAGTTATGTGVTTAGANRKLIWIGNNWDGTGTLTPPSGMVERFDGVCYLADEDRLTGGATGNRTQTVASADPWQAYMVALKPVTSSLSAAGGSYSFTGATVNLTKTGNKSIVAGAGSYSFGGSPVTLTKTGVPGGGLVFRAVSSINYAQRSAVTTVDKPIGTVNDDIMIATLFMHTSVLADIVLDTAPSGWTQIGTTTSTSADATNYERFWVFWKRALSEGASYDFLHNNTLFTQASIVSYSGGITTGSPVDVFSQNSANTGSTATATGVTTTVANTKLVWTGHNYDNTQTLSPPTGMTERFDSLIYQSDEDKTSAGATGNRTQTLASSNPWQAYLVALKPTNISAKTVLATGGSYSFTGTDMTPRKGVKTIASGGAYLFTGTTVTVGMGLLASGGAYTFLGGAATPRRGRRPQAESGAYAFTGTPITLAKTYPHLLAAGGAYSFTGSPVGQRRTRTIPALAGAYSFTGVPINLAKTGSGMLAEGGFYSFTGRSVSFQYPAIIDPLPNYRAVASTTYEAGLVSTIVNKPTGTVDGDVMIAAIMVGNSSPDGVVCTPPAGWTQIGNPDTIADVASFDSKLFVFWKRASSEPASYTFTHPSGSVSSQAVIASYSNARGIDNPIDSLSLNSATGVGTTTATALGITPNEANTKLIYISNNYNGTGATAPSGMTERFDNYVYISDQDFEAIEPTGDRVQTLSPSSPWQTYLIALRSSVFSIDVAVTSPGMVASVGSISFPAWDAQTLTGSGALTYYDMVVTATAPPTVVSVRSLARHSQGKHYVETTFFGGDPTGNYGLLDPDTNTGITIELGSGSIVERPSGVITPMFDPITDGDTIGMAYDGDLGRVWFKVNDGPWNNDPAQAPDGTGIGLWEPPTDVGCSGPLILYTGPDPLKIEVEGTIIENLDIQYGFVNVRANNVTIRNCNIFATEYFGIAPGQPITGLVIDHCTISSAGRSACIETGNGFIVRNCDLTGNENGIFVGSDGLVENCYIHSLSMSPEAHVDGIQFGGNNNNVEINNCWIEAFDTSDIIIKADAGAIDNVRVEDCTLIDDVIFGQKTAAAVYAYSLGDQKTTSVFLNRNRMAAGFDGTYVATFDCTPEAFDNIDYYTGEPILPYYAGFSFPSGGVVATVETGFVHVAPVEPRGSGIRTYGNYVGIVGPTTATPTFRSDNLSPYARISDAFIPPPAGIQVGDVLIVTLFRGVANAVLRKPVPFSPGWTQIGSYQEYDYLGFHGELSVWWKYVGTSEPSQYTWAYFDAVMTQWHIAAYSSCNQAYPFEQFSQNGGTSDTATGLSVGTTQLNSKLLWIGSNWTGATPAPPTGMTERIDQTLYIAEEVIAAHGPTGNRTQTQADDAPWQATLLALKGA